IGIFQHLLQTIHFCTMSIDELAAIPGEIPEVPNLDGRDKTPPQESMLQEFGDPSAVLHIRLAPRHLFDVGGIDQQDGEVPLEQIKNGLPVHARTLHGDDCTPMGLEPGTHGQDVTGHGPKAADVLLALLLIIAGHQTHFDVLFVDIHASTSRIENAHGGFLPSGRMASVATHALRRISSEDKSPLRAPREGATSGGAVKMRASDSTSGMAHQRIPDDCAATWWRQHTAGPFYFHGSWCMKVHEGFY